MAQPDVPARAWATERACSSFLEQGRERERSEVEKGKEERGEPGEQVEGGDWAGLTAAE